jgi:hypothetical protein
MEPASHTIRIGGGPLRPEGGDGVTYDADRPE